MTLHTYTDFDKIFEKQRKGATGLDRLDAETDKQERVTRTRRHEEATDSQTVGEAYRDNPQERTTHAVPVSQAIANHFITRQFTLSISMPPTQILWESPYRLSALLMKTGSATLVIAETAASCNVNAGFTLSYQSWETPYAFPYQGDLWINLVTGTTSIVSIGELLRTDQ